ncbi:MAG: transglycosylase SLT domain-containing protein [Desulfobacteraceae bacterium]|nr:transglycosylase SLT domain-containing protein [Desulfobacteraceae bacterium]
MKTIFLFFCIMFLGVTTAFGQSAEYTETASVPPLISSIEISPPVSFCGEKVPLDNQDVYERLEKELLLSVWRRSQVVLWLKRIGRYMPYIESMLKKNKMPADLKYVPIVESALLPHIGSSKNAIGYWQFIRPTGLRYGLKINSHMDERRNIYKSTVAAIKYLKKLHGDFGSWTLSAAAYNMGEGGLRSRINFQKTRDFYNLYLPLETQQYILKIVAAKMILSDPKKYGFSFTKEDLYSPAEFDRIQVNCHRETSIQTIAQAAKTYFKTIKDLNPELRGRRLPRGVYTISVPKGAARGFHARFKKVSSEYAAKKKKRRSNKHIYVVKQGDSLSAIATKFNISLSELLRWNRRLRLKKPIYPGSELVIYKR